MKLQPSSATQFEILEPGVYPATIDSVTPKDASPKFDDSSPQLQYVFLATDPETGTEANVFGWTGQTMGPKSKLRVWLQVLMPDLDPDKDELDTDDLIGKSCRIVVTVKKGSDGIERNRVGEVLPLEQRGRRQATQQKAEQPAAIPF